MKHERTKNSGHSQHRRTHSSSNSRGIRRSCAPKNAVLLFVCIKIKLCIFNDGKIRFPLVRAKGPLSTNFGEGSKHVMATVQSPTVTFSLRNGGRTARPKHLIITPQPIRLQNRPTRTLKNQNRPRPAFIQLSVTIYRLLNDEIFCDV